ncbi:acetyltransferase [Malaciobacter molluscorum LMG 25693]|uniref:Acetyltransferase n=1 Tax=Malaciobacter molluscorum LMG 25693 TaxID=870501 RepID=A0AB33H249_9BACT|nr:GNAT family protein [Malaciobacter molluscorum]AXX92032.1 acetyltransferase [Malaciobacter molluscorum LMG 25693]
MTILTTKRLILRTFTKLDIDTLYEDVFKCSDVVKYTFGNENFSYEQTKNFINNNCNFKDKIGLSIIEKKDTNEIIGLGGVLQCEYLDEIDYEIGFILAKRFWKKGFAKEIGQAQIDFIKDKLKAKKALALVDTNNTASIKTIKSLGFNYLKSVKTTDSRKQRDVYILNFQ